MRCEVNKEVFVTNANLYFIRIDLSYPVPPYFCFAVKNPLSGGHYHERNFSLCCGMFSLPLDRVTTPTVSYFFIIRRGTELILKVLQLPWDKQATGGPTASRNNVRRRQQACMWV
jgi:hypothetical protein